MQPFFTKLSKTITHYLLNYCYMQLLLMTVATPILITWQLPITPLALIGNLLFTPFLIIVLGCSSLLFFGQLLFIPVLWCSPLINWTADWWLIIMTYAPTTLLQPYTAHAYSCLLTALPFGALLLFQRYPITIPYRIFIVLGILTVELLLHWH